MTTNAEKAVRDAAAALFDAITKAEAAGLRVDLPSNAAGLQSIAISETKKAPQPIEKDVPAKAAPKPASKVADKT